MSYPVAKAVVKAYVKATMDSNPSFAGGSVTILSGRGIGLKGLKVGYERDISEEDGYYEGLRDQFDTLRASGTIECMVRLVDNTKFVIGKWGQYFHLQRELFDAAGTKQVTDVSIGKLKSCMPEEDGRGGFQISIMCPLERLTVTVT